MLGSFPMILIVVILYNLLAFGGGASGHDITAVLDRNFSIQMVSGDLWKISVGDLFILLGLAMLFIETVKATRTTKREIVNHALAMLTFVVALVEFLMLKGFATSTFFILTAMSLFDVVGGYTISIVAARRDMEMAPRA